MNHRQLQPAALMLLALLFVSACSRTFDKQSVCGRYIANHGRGLDVIELQSDGTYLYSFKAPGGRDLNNKGKWEIYKQEGQTRITFHDFLFGLKGYGGELPGYWDVKVDASWTGRPCLVLDPDLNYYYVKE